MRRTEKRNISPFTRQVDEALWDKHSKCDIWFLRDK